jgi:hypothetical protein
MPAEESNERSNDLQESDFAAQAGQERSGLAGEFVEFLKDNKKWWLAPIIICILGLGLLVLLGGTAAAPFIYTLF